MPRAKLACPEYQMLLHLSIRHLHPAGVCLRTSRHSRAGLNSVAGGPEVPAFDPLRSGNPGNLQSCVVR